MWLLDVVPITRSLAGYGALTYFSTKNLSAGALVEVLIRKKKVLAIVVKAEKLERKKAELKRSLFALKKIEGVLAPQFTAGAFGAAIFKTSEYFLAPSSMLAHFFLPKAVLNSTIGKLRLNFEAADLQNANRTSNGVKNNLEFGVSAYQALRADRLRYYRGLIREALSRGRSSAILAPTINSAEDIFREISRGMEERTFLLHSELPLKSHGAIWEKIRAAGQPCVIVGTGTILAFLRNDCGLLIIEEHSSEHYYNSMRRPFFDLRKTAEFLAREMNLHLVLGDIVLPLGLDERYVLAYSNTRILSQAENKIIDAGGGRKGEFKVISPELADRLRAIFDSKESAVLISQRRGFSPTTVCQDCGRTMVCGHCENPLVLHQKSRKTSEAAHFICHYCLRRTEVFERCPYCKSWRLASYGIGVEKIGEELKRILPEVKLFRLDSDVARSRKEAEKIKEDFLSREGNFLVATEIFLNFFQNPLPHILATAVDGLFSLPDYRMHERIFRFLIRLRALAQKSFVVQTRLAEHPVFQYALSGNISGFKTDEMRERERLKYPPAVDLIKITFEDKDRQRLISKISVLSSELKKWSPVDFPAFITKIRGRFRWHILLKLPRGSWPEKQPELHAYLSGLAPSWIVQVEPPSLL